MKSFNKLIIYTLLLAFFSSFNNSVSAQRGGEFIYGKITTKSKEQFIGYMRWGKQELMWHDVFNSTKVPTKRVNHSKDKPKSLWDDFSWDLSSIWEDKYRSTSHLFSCFFGDIKTIRPRSGDKVDLELKNGTTLKLDGGSDDIGGTIYIHDYELGLVKLKWSKISKIEFSQGPDELNEALGKPIYGKVKTYRNGVLEGYIKWDLDERTSEDILDGSSKSQQVAFKNIKTIKKKDGGALIGLKTGREVYYCNSNDVNSQNRGIGVFVEGVGNVQVYWKDFKYAELYDNPHEGMGYNDFKTPVGIKAEIVTVDDDALEGLIVFDIDEKWEIEFIDGKDDNIDYQVPFRNIKRIVPKNKTFTQIYLRNGEVLLLGESQDVSYYNDGVLLFTSNNKEPEHVKWENILEINIK